ncbi:M15 family metallopeptidase [Salinithrix halophila]|uniref:M15 family metallopeptidase n=1 Tax=Salinithrix halophila TaxID=1485204 RepID=A0ABV8JIQ4_9BACL
MTDWHSLQVLVNKQNPLPEGFIPQGLTVPSVRFSFEGDHPKKKLRREAAEALERLFAAADAKGLELFALSGYRSYETQEKIFLAHVNRVGEAEANRESARPGKSEHQTGLAMDVTSRSVGCHLLQDFGETPEGRWVARHAPDFGFIIRYPQGKEAITGYIYEPWHLRYLGEEWARAVTDSGLTFEEYLQSDSSRGR